MRDILKLTLRTVKNSLGRYVAIFAIIALGVGFFSGLRVTKDAMLNVGDEYIKKYALFDLRILSTYGFTDEDIEFFEEQRRVKNCVGGYNIDIIYKRDDGEEGVLRAHSITDGINELNVIEGKIPSSPNECVVDARCFPSSYIGRKIRLSDGNHEDTLNSLNYKEFKIVGRVNSVYYLNFQRGSTTVGNGSLAGFIYLDKQAFNMPRYTEMFITLDDSEFIYSESYNEMMENASEDFEEICRDYRNQLYSSLLSSANSALEKAKDEYKEGKKEYDEKESMLKAAVYVAEKSVTALNYSYERAKVILEDSKEKLDDSYNRHLITKKDYEDGLEKIREAEAELENLKGELDEAVSTYEKALTEMEKQLADGKIKLEEGEKQIADAEKEIEKLVRPKYYVLTRDTNIGYVAFDNDSSIVLGISKVFPIFFFLVAALVSVTTMSRMVTEHRQQIGTLKALGYDNRQINAIYAIYSGSAALLGCVFGFILGSFAIPKIIWTVYNIMYGFADIRFVFSIPLAAASLLISVAASVGVAYISVTRELSEKPAALMRPKGPGKNKAILPEKITFIWKRLSFLSKASIRNIYTQKVRFLMMLLGVGGCTALLLTGFGVKDSIANIASDQFTGIMKYDCSVSFGSALTPSEADELANNAPFDVEGILFINQSSVELERPDKTIKNAYLMVCQKQSKNQSFEQFISIHDGKKELSFPKTGEAVVTRSLAKELGLSEGDKIEMTNSDMKRLEFIISGICDNFVNSYIYISPESYINVVRDEIKYNGCLLNIKDSTDVHQAAADFSEISGDVTALSVNEDVENSISSMLETLNVIVYLVTVCAAALAFIVIYNLTNLNITERQRELATMKVIGFRPGETAGYVFRENLLQSILGMAIGIPMGIWLHSFVMSQIKIEMVTFDVKILPFSYIISLALSLVFAIIVDFALYPKINKISMTDSLKSVE